MGYCVLWQYLSFSIVPRWLRWYIPPNDGLFDDESNTEWGDFFVGKGLELLRLLLLRKHRKKKWLESQIKEITDRIESFKDTTEFIQLSGDLKTKQRHMRKRVFAWPQWLFGGKQVFVYNCVFYWKFSKEKTKYQYKHTISKL